ncbi:hypothetical protein CABS03_11849 [Colletotrichum abscissum]|uniref:Uncharacterized protein n=1 Tax=Colletotrichum abscissum TaxID=1671311 RepID=A0A9P9XNQ9_9PEZI|nr:hypothetical protein CABS02_02368 [Colletotrichum abscissum]
MRFVDEGFSLSRLFLQTTWPPTRGRYSRDVLSSLGEPA